MEHNLFELELNAQRRNAYLFTTPNADLYLRISVKSLKRLEAKYESRFLAVL
ncbi:hypothetical protein BH23BAC3_BH23BAC3_14100 [soil metagenome]